MQKNTLKLNTPRKKRKTIGRGGKKGTYSGKGMKGQKARSGGNVNPLFEGGRSTLIDHMKKNRGFKGLKDKKNVINLKDIDKKFKDGEIISVESLVKAGFFTKKEATKGVKILGVGKITKKLTVAKNILLSKTAASQLTVAEEK